MRLPLLLSLITCAIVHLGCPSSGSSGGGEADAATGGGGGCTTNCTPNTPQDRDGDGAMDYILCGDFNGDGRLTMELGCTNADPGSTCDAPGEKGDLLACLETLDDADGRTLEILPGRYTVPDEPFTAHNGPPFSAEAGILELPSNTTLRCQAGAVLMGTDERHADAPDQLSVIYVPESSSGVVIEDCEIDQGWPDGHFCGGDPAGCFPTGRMGVFLKGNGNVVRNNKIHHTRHSCIYTKDGNFNEISGNEVDWCGGAWSSSPVARYPGIYVFSDDGQTVDGVRISDNRCDHTNAACINTRLQTDTQGNRIRGLIVERNTHITTSPNADGRFPPCVVLRGIEDALIEDMVCEGTTGVALFAGDGRYLSDPGCSDAAGTWHECMTANRNVTLRRVTVRDTPSGRAFSVGGFNEGITVEDLVVAGSDRGHCIRALSPIRDLSVRDALLSDCLEGGIRIGSTSRSDDWGANDPAETLELIDIEIENADGDLLDGFLADGIRLIQGCVGCRIEGLRVSGWTRAGIRVDPGHDFRDNLLTDIELDQMGTWHAGTLSVAQLPACNAGRAGLAYTVNDAANASSCSAGAGMASNLCVCDGAQWQDTDVLGETDSASPGIELRDATAIEDNTISELRCTDVRRRGHCVEVPQTAASNVFDTLHADDERGVVDPALEDVNDGVLNLRGALGNQVMDATCTGLRSGQVGDARPCVCTDVSCGP